MNRRQKIVVMVGVVVVALMLLVPPWRSHSSARRTGDFYRGASTSAAGYGLLFYPPRGSAAVDTSRLAVQCVLVAVLTYGGYVMLGHKKED